jgi:hypothetical protein
MELKSVTAKMPSVSVDQPVACREFLCVASGLFS